MTAMDFGLFDGVYLPTCEISVTDKYRSLKALPCDFNCFCCAYEDCIAGTEDIAEYERIEKGFKMPLGKLVYYREYRDKHRDRINKSGRESMRKRRSKNV